MDNRRIQFRKYLRTTVIIAAPGVPAQEARTFDVSSGGLGLVSQVSLAKGSSCRVALTLLFSDRSTVRIETLATVAYSLLSTDQGGFKLGVQFAGLAPAAETALDKFLRS